MRMLAWVMLVHLGWMTPALAQSVSAILEPVTVIELKPSVAGRLATLDVAEGDGLAKGAVLAAMDARVQEARVALAKIAAASSGPEDRARIVVEQAEQLLARMTKARQRGAAQAWEVRQAEQALALAQADARIASENATRLGAQLELEQATLSEFVMQAPFNGTVLQIIAEPGAIVDTDETILEFGNLARLSATAFLPVDWAQSLKVGDSVAGTLAGSELSKLDLTVAAVDPRIDPASRSVRVRLEMDNPDRRHFAGTAIQLQRP